MLDAMVQDHERATGQWHVEWQALPTAFIIASGGLRAAREVLEGLEVRPEAMRRVLDTTGGLIVAEAVMMGLAPALGRQVAHDLVQDCCRVVLTTDKPFLDALAAEPRIAAVMSRAELARLVDPANYLGAAPEMTRRLLARRQG
jgi:3-carboxy-cis,cis-muconate cycloisomerase